MKSLTEKIAVFDLESDGLLDKVTKIHCLVVFLYDNGELVKTFKLTSYKQIIKLFNTNKFKEYTLCGHNIIRYDIPVLKKILSLEVTNRLIDTLGVSWYLYNERKKHGLDEWGIDVGIAKPKVDDWVNLTTEDYLHRCTEDVKINSKILFEFTNYLEDIYEGDFSPMIDYINFKLDCAREQEEIGWRLDVELAKKTLNQLLEDYKEKELELKAAMPKVPIKATIKRPESLFLKSGKDKGKLSVRGRKWLEICRDEKVERKDILTLSELTYTKGYDEPNPGSHVQIKNWLFSLGWEPCTFDYKKDKKNPEAPPRKIPQVQEDGELTPSVLKLIEREPSIEVLRGISIISHRITVFNGFLENVDENGFLQACVQGFTNSMRFMHTVIVNLPTIHRPYGQQIRGSLLAPDENHVLCGSDMSSLEDNTKQHYMYYFDPEYVKTMRTPGFSPHLDIGVQGGMITQEESDFYIWYDAVKGNDQVVIDLYEPKVIDKYKTMTDDEKHKEFKRISGIRKDSKQVNFSAVYGVGASKLSLTTGWPMEKSKNLLEIYWERNWAVKSIAKKVKVKTVRNQLWLLNPISRLWYPLRYEKDIFSLLNQSTGVWCFDQQVKMVRTRYKLCGQFHDEIIFPLPKGTEEECSKFLDECINKVNKLLKLNIDLGISKDFGDSYADVH